MFEIGDFYTITMRGAGADGDTVTIFTEQVVKVQLPLIVIKKFDGGELIINTSSPAFISAKRRSQAA